MEGGEGEGGRRGGDEQKGRTWKEKIESRGHSGTEWLHTAERPHGAKAVNA